MDGYFTLSGTLNVNEPSLCDHILDIAASDELINFAMYVNSIKLYNRSDLIRISQ